jgi:hypothetical protein
MTSSKKKSSTKSRSKKSVLTLDLSTLADRTVAALDKLEATLPIDHQLPPAELAQARGLQRVPPQAIAIAMDILVQQPERFPDFDLESAKDALQYELVMRSIAAKSRTLTQHIEKSVLKRRAQAAQQTLVLYATMKGLGRIAGNEGIREKVRDLHAVMVRSRKSGKRAKTATSGASASSNAQPAGAPVAPTAGTSPAPSVTHTTPAVASPVTPSTVATTPTSVIVPADKTANAASNGASGLNGSSTAPNGASSATSAVNGAASH